MSCQLQGNPKRKGFLSASTNICCSCLFFMCAVQFEIHLPVQPIPYSPLMSIRATPFTSPIRSLSRIYVVFLFARRMENYFHQMIHSFWGLQHPPLSSVVALQRLTSVSTISWQGQCLSGKFIIPAGSNRDKMSKTLSRDKGCVMYTAQDNNDGVVKILYLVRCYNFCIITGTVSTKK